MNSAMCADSAAQFAAVALFAAALATAAAAAARSHLPTARLAEEMRRAENRRMGRRSTILTTSSGLNDEDAEISEKTLLG